MTEHIPIFTEMSECEHLNLTDIAVYGAVYFFSFKGEKIFNQSYETTAKKLSIKSKVTVKTALKKLSDLGIIRDLTPNKLNAPHEYKTLWMPEDGYQKLASITKAGYQKLIRRVSKIDTQTPKRVSKIDTNKKSTKEIKNGGQKPPTPKAKTNRRPTKRNLALGELEKEFIRISNIQKPTRKKDNGFWYSGFDELYNIAGKDVEIGKQLIVYTIKKLREDELTISGPNSLVKTARSIMAIRTRQRQATIEQDGGAYL